MVGSSVGYYISDDDDFTEIGSTNKYNSLHDGNVSMSVSLPFAKHFTLTPMVAGSFALTDKSNDLIKDWSFGDDSTFIYGGLTVSTSM